MVQVTIPVTTYSVHQNKPTNPFGSPGQMPISAKSGANTKAICRMALDKVPTDGVISSAKFRVYAQRATNGSRPLRLYPNTAAWTSSVTWNKRPAIGTLIGTVSAGGGVNTMWEWDVTSWATTRSRNGLTIDTTDATGVFIKGSSFADMRPILVVTYTVNPDTPSNLVPDGGAVSVPSPIITYTGDDEMTQQRIQFSQDGINVSYDTGWINATSGVMDPAATPGTPALAAGGSIYWRAQTTGANGQSAVSPWAQYSYQPLPVITILNPPAQTDDGTPTLQWSVAGDQQSWQATFRGDNGNTDHSNWQSNTDTDWTTTRGVKVPGGVGVYTLQVQDAFNRVTASKAPVFAQATQQFTTALVDTGIGVDTINTVFDDPIVIFTGNRVGGIPDYIGLFRDGVQVPLWDPVDGTAYMWAPAVNFFVGSDYTVIDYTADLRHEHTWQIKSRIGTTTGGGGPVAKYRFHTDGVWLVDPRTNERVQIWGYNQAPVVDQSVEEGSILHTPVHGDLIVEPVRRRLMRTTRSGSFNGLLVGADEDIVQDWIMGDSALKYRLIFGKANWSVILGDYVPIEVFYPDDWGEDRVLFTMNWWERLRDY